MLAALPALKDCTEFLGRNIGFAVYRLGLSGHGFAAQAAIFMAWA